MPWWIEHGPLSGGRAEQDAWSQSGRGTKMGAIEHIRQLLVLGCTVHALRAPDDTLVMDEGAITSRYGSPKGA
jgi:hypothetical protein